MSEEKKWTEDQDFVINDRGHNLLVSASAGSGKTTCMTERIARLVGAGEPISNFLVVTFTKASATDMKQKIVKALEELEPSEFVLEQIDAVDTSDISDLHSFYSRVVSSYFYEVGIDPGYKIIDEAEANYLRNETIDKLFDEKENEGDEKFFELTDKFQKSRKDRELKEKVFEFSKRLASFGEPEAWFEETLKKSYNEDLNNNECAKIINSYVSNRIAKIAKDAENFAKRNLEAGFEKYFEYYNGVSEKLRAVKKNATFIQNTKQLFDIKFDTRPRVSKKLNLDFLAAEGGVVLDKIKDEVINFKNNFISSDEEYLKKNLAGAKEDLVALYNLTAEFDKKYSEKKREIGALDFGDLERFTYKILCNEKIAEAIRNRYKYVFVDEYQDVNSVQEKILDIVSSENNRFMVGDVKQSIYRFRLCDPEAFLAKYYEYGDENPTSKLRKLNKNFRSDKKILKFVDKVFSGIMTKDFGGIDYADEASFEAGDDNYDAPESVNLCFVDITKEKEEKKILKGVYSVKNHSSEEKTELKAAEAEAIYVAGKISEIIKTKKANFSDFAILVFKRGKSLAKFIEVLERNHIEVSADEKYDLVTKNYVEEILNLAKVLFVSEDDYLVFKVLKSRFFGLTDDELAMLKKSCPELKFHDLIFMNKNIENAKIAKKIEKFNNFVKKYREFAGNLKIRDLVRRIANDFDVFKLELTEKNGEKINAEIEKMINLLPDKWAAEFVLLAEDFSIESESDTGGNYVKIMTVHKSKGMEFKYVFLVDNIGRINYMSARGDIIFSKDLGIGMNYFDSETRVKTKSIPNSAAGITEYNKIAEEQQRVLYVALTRAQEKLFVVCSASRDDLKEEFPERPQNYNAWFSRIILDGLNDKLEDFINFEVLELDSIKFEKDRDENQPLLSSGESEEKNEFVYDYSKYKMVPLKNSVSKILQSGNVFDDEFDDEYESSEMRLAENFSKSSADRGTAYHKFFELYDFLDEKPVQEKISETKKMIDDELVSYIEDSKINSVLSLEFFKNLKVTDRLIKEREFFANIDASVLGGCPGDKIILQGVIDLLVVNDDGIILLDYKTGKINDEKLKKYKFQVDSYANVAERAFGMKVNKRFLCLIDEQKMLEI